MMAINVLLNICPLMAHFVFPEILILNIGRIVALWCCNVAMPNSHYT